MATSAFKSTTRRTPIGKSTGSDDSSSYSSSSNRQSSNSAHRRSRSLSRFSRPIRPPTDDSPDELTVPSGRFVNKSRGSAFSDVTLDDLAVEFFSSGDRGRSFSRNSDEVGAGDINKGSVSQRRGRSVSRRVSEGKGSIGNSASGGGGGGGRVSLESNNSRRRRSVSVVRYQISDSESDLDHSHNLNNRATSKSFNNGGRSQGTSLNKGAVSNSRPGLRRSLSQSNFKYHDGYSSHSSVVTDDEGRDAHYNVNGAEKAGRAVYSQKALKKPSNDLSQSKNANVLQAVSTIKRNYATELELSEKRKQDLLAEILLEEQRRRELSMMVKELLPEPKNDAEVIPSSTRKKSNDRSRMSKRLTEEAEKYFEDFISNVEDTTDISSLDGEMTDTSSSLGGITKTQVFQSPAISKSIPVEMDGVVLPWLKWETSNDGSLSRKKTEIAVTPRTHSWGAAQVATPNSISSHGSWSPGIADGHSTSIGEVAGNIFGELGSYYGQHSSNGTKKQFDVEEYLKRQSEEDFLFERWNQQQRIHSGGLLLCNQVFF